MAYQDKRVVSLGLILTTLVLMLAPVHGLAQDLPVINFEQLFEQLKNGRQYDETARKGFIRGQRTNEAGQVFEYAISVPDSYDAAKPMPLHVLLHGGISRPASQIKRWWKGMSRFAVPQSITIYPLSTRKTLWWSNAQVENISALVKKVKSQYNVDENRVYLQGVSDGGTSVYYMASRDNTQWAGLMSYIGSALVLINPKTSVKGHSNLGNLINKPLFVLNGAMDRLYPSATVVPFIKRLQSFDADVQFHDIPGGKHNLKWYGSKQSEIRQFIKNKVRQPYPDAIFWQVNAQMRFPRSHWLVFDQLKDATKGGILDIKKLDNRVYVNVDNVKQFTLLISPEHFDMNEAIKVIINKQFVFNAKVERDVEVLQHWADIDQDRTQLYGGKVVVNL